MEKSVQNTKKAWLLISRHNDISFWFTIIFLNHIKICRVINGKKNLNINRRVWKETGKWKSRSGLESNNVTFTSAYLALLYPSDQKGIFKYTCWKHSNFKHGNLALNNSLFTLTKHRPRPFFVLSLIYFECIYLQLDMCL